MVTDQLDELERHLAARLREPLPGPPAQRRFAPQPLMEGWTPELEPGTARRAAALLLLYPSADGTAVPLTVRHADLSQHAGQISLPGGRIDPGESGASAALREAEEEIGVVAADVRIIGALSTLWIPISNFVLTPYVAVTDRAPAFRLHPHEVAELVEMPLRHLRDDSAISWQTRDRRGMTIRYPAFTFAHHLVWGATAMVLGEFVEVLR